MWAEVNIVVADFSCRYSPGEIYKYLFAPTGRFGGEDGNCKERSKVQKEQMRWWIQKQIGEREKAERERQEAEKAYQEAVISRDKRAMALDRSDGT